METVNVSGLKNNPSEALRKARSGLVVVMNRDRPDAVLMHLDSSNDLGAPGVRQALATALFKDGNLSLGRAAHLAGMPVAEFMQHLSRLGIPVIEATAEETLGDMETLDSWLASS